MEQIILTSLKCKRCGHSWIPRAKTPPAVCPSCKSKVWDKAKNKKGNGNINS